MNRWGWLSATAVAAALTSFGAWTGPTAVGAATAYVPGPGVFMLLVQADHQKLVLAGRAGNWDLASHYLSEIGENLQNLLTYSPQVDGVAVAAPTRKFLNTEFKGMQDAVKARDAAKFAIAAANLPTGCNTCHLAMKKPEILVQDLPEGANPYPDQLFAVPPH